MIKNEKAICTPIYNIARDIKHQYLRFNDVTKHMSI